MLFGFVSQLLAISLRYLESLVANQSKEIIPNEWDHNVIIDWLVNEGRFLPDLDKLVHQLGNHMINLGVPISRLRMGIKTVHPLIAAYSTVWERDTGQSQHIANPHGLENRHIYIGSPLAYISETGYSFRKRLLQELSSDDHESLHELKARGATDYFGLPMKYTDQAFGVLIFVTDSTDGFEDTDVVHFTKIAAILAPITESYRSRQIATAVAETYLGPRTGRKVLDGQITRGHIQGINAAILMSDIRDWTGLNDRLPADEVIALANGFFEIIADAVETNSGEILKFIGDAVLAIFPADDENCSPKLACKNAFAAAKETLHRAANSEPSLGIEFGIGLHFGKVLYGNVGSKSRMDFTVSGKAVNTTARIESMCSKFDMPLLVSKEVAIHLDNEMQLISNETLKGYGSKINIFAPATS